MVLALEAEDVSDQPPRGVYQTWTEPCWYVTLPIECGAAVPMIRSSRLLAIGQVSGSVLYDGSACDEG